MGKYCNSSLSLSLRPVAALYLITYLFKHLVLDVVVAALVVSFFLSIKREHIHTCDQSEIIIFMKTTSRYEKRKIHHTFYRLLYMIFTVSCRSSRWNTHKKKERKYNKILTLNMLELGIFRVLYK